MNPTIKIDFIEKQKEITLKMNWTDKGWNLHDYTRFYQEK